LKTLDYVKGVEPKLSTIPGKKILETSWRTLTDCFKDEHYIIGIDKRERIVICISHTAQNDDSILLRAYMMGCFLHQTWNNRGLTHGKTSRKLRIANLYAQLINVDAKRCLNWYNHITASSQKGGLPKPNTTLFSGWDISKNKTREIYYYDNPKKIHSPSLISMIKDWKKKDNEYKNGTRKHETKSELIIIKETNERYIILYSIE
jgi:hypothetical protein